MLAMGAVEFLMRIIFLTEKVASGMVSGGDMTKRACWVVITLLRISLCTGRRIATRVNKPSETSCWIWGRLWMRRNCSLWSFGSSISVWWIGLGTQGRIGRRLSNRKTGLFCSFRRPYIIKDAHLKGAVYFMSLSLTHIYAYKTLLSRTNCLCCEVCRATQNVSCILPLSGPLFLHTHVKTHRSC